VHAIEGMSEAKGNLSEFTLLEDLENVTHCRSVDGWEGRNLFFFFRVLDIQKADDENWFGYKKVLQTTKNPPPLYIILGCNVIEGLKWKFFHCRRQQLDFPSKMVCQELYLGPNIARSEGKGKMKAELVMYTNGVRGGNPWQKYKSYIHFDDYSVPGAVSDYSEEIW